MKKRILIWSCTLLVIISSYFAWAETITLTTYYPAPYGVYKEMRAKRMAIGDNYYQGSNYYWPGEGSGGTEIDANADLIIEGNVGIGTTGPYYQLDNRFNNSATSFSGGNDGDWGGQGLRIQNTNTTAGTMACIHLRAGDGGDNHIVAIAPEEPDRADTAFFFEGIEKVRFTTEGNVGIGTTSPGAKLEINDNTGNLFKLTNTPGEDYTIIGNDSAGAFILDTYGAHATVSPGQYVWKQAGVEVMRIKAGNVGIGTTGPFLKLHAVSGAINTSPFVLESNTSYDVFSVLPHSNITYLSSGIYYKSGAWIHDATGVYNCLFGISGDTGGRWYASNSSTGSWNVASNVELWTSAGVLVGASSRELKENFASLDYDNLLQRIDQLEISRWNYKTEGPSVTHIGPVSEDFWQLFGTGDSDKRIALIDESGVALAGVKALSAKAKTQQQQIERLQQEIEELKLRLNLGT